MSRHRFAPRGFTLVELLVVIGIIAVLIGVLLPVLSKAQGRARDLKCQSQLREMGSLLMAYSVENKGSLPYGLYFVRADNKGQPLGGDFTNVSWASTLGKLSQRGGRADNDDFSFPPFLQCPEAISTFPHLVSYVASMVMMPRMDHELRETPDGQQVIRPATLSRLRPGSEKILIHDTNITPEMENSLGLAVNFDVDWNTGDTRGRFTYPDIPQYRFMDANDVYEQMSPPVYGNNRPVRFHPSYRNRDASQSDKGVFVSDGYYPYQGNLRFRHGGNKICYALFADGHVGGLTFVANGNGQITKTDALRKYFMPQWPTGIKRRDDVP